MKKFNFILLLIILPYIYSFSNENFKPTTILGFINKSPKGNEAVNIVITKSLINFLSRIQGAEITPYQDIVNVAESDYWILKENDVDKAISIAQSFNSKQVVIGDYIVDEDKETVEINVFVYDTIAGELILKRNYKGKAGIDTFDTIDTVIKNVSGVLIGREISVGHLKYSIQSSNSIYELYINGKKIIDMQNNDLFEEQFIIGEPLEISLRLKSNGKEVDRQSVMIDSNKITDLVYTPKASLRIVINNDPFPKNTVLYLNNQLLGSPDSQGNFWTNQLPISNEQQINVLRDNQVISSKKIQLKEGEDNFVIINLSQNNQSAKGNRLVFLDLRLDQDSEISQKKAETIYNSFYGDLLRSKKFEIIHKDEVQKLSNIPLKDLNQTQLDELFIQIPYDLMMSGNISRLGKLYLLDLQIREPNGRVIYSKVIKEESLESIVKNSQKYSFEIIREIFPNETNIAIVENNVDHTPKKRPPHRKLFFLRPSLHIADIGISSDFARIFRFRMPSQFQETGLSSGIGLSFCLGPLLSLPLRFDATGGAILVRNDNVFTYLPYAEANAGLNLSLDDMVRFSLLGGYLWLTDKDFIPKLEYPTLRAEIEFGAFFIDAGIRLSDLSLNSYFYPMIGAGLRF